MATMRVNPAAGSRSLNKTRKSHKIMIDVGGGPLMEFKPSKHKGTKKRRKR